MASLHFGSSFLCEICGKTFNREDNLKTHQITCSKKSNEEAKYFTATSNGLPTCEKCGMWFPFVASLKRHQNSVCFNNSKKKCLTCEKEFYDKATLNKHIKSVHGKGVSAYPCKTCDNICKSSRDAKIHAKTHNPVVISSSVGFAVFEQTDEPVLTCPLPASTSTTDNYNCNICDKSFIHSSNLKRHKVNVHENNPKLKCSICSVMFKTKYTLSKHLKTNTYINLQSKLKKIPF